MWLTFRTGLLASRLLPNVGRTGCALPGSKQAICLLLQVSRLVMADKFEYFKEPYHLHLQGRMIITTCFNCFQSNCRHLLFC